MIYRRVPFNVPKLIKFLLVGCLNTMVGFIVFSVAIYLTDKNIGLSLAANIGTGIIFNFFSYGLAVFKALGINQFAKFALVYVFLYIINYGAIYLMTGYNINIYVAQFINLFYLAPVSYILLSTWVFGGNPQSFAIKNSPPQEHLKCLIIFP